MNEKDHKPDDRLEGMLRKWGAEEAAGQAGVPPVPAAIRPTPWRTTLLRWAAPLAAAAMLLVAVGLFVATTYQHMAPGRKDAAPAHEDIQSLKAELARTRADLRAARAALAQAASQPMRENERLKAEIATLKQDFEKEKTDFLAQAHRRIAALNHVIGEKDAQLTGLAEVLKETRILRAAEKKRLAELAGKCDQMQVKVTAFGAELARLEKASRQAAVDKQKAETELSALKARHEALMSEFQRAYLAAASASGADVSSGRINLPVRQMAARDARLLGRCAELRPSVYEASTGRLMDRLEVVLTRLNLMNPADAAEADAFAALIRGGLVKEIDEVLAKSRERPDVRAWLLEARLILAGAEHVG